MHRLLIVDDEHIIVDSIYQLLQQSIDSEMEIYRAYNGFEALELMNKTRVDLVISDIRMPGMDGIEIQRAIISKWRYCKIIFLTGFNDFEYMQQAIRTGGITDYLLKNEDDELIVQAVKKALAEIELQEDLRIRIQQSDAKHQEALAALKNNTLFDNRIESPLQLAKNLALCEIALSADEPVWVMSGKIDRWNKPMTEEDRELLRYACQNIMVEYLGSLNTSTCISYAVDRFAWVIQPTDIRDTEIPLDEKEILWRNLQSRMGSIAEAAQAACAHWLQIPISLALGKAPCAWEHFREEVQHLDKLLKENEYRGGELLIQDYDREVWQHDSFSDREDESVLPDRSNRLIAHIHNYVMLNLNQELSLTRVSEYVHHSPTYLSRLYRRLTGTTLFEYITEQRMSRAKQYLQGDGMKIHEIASAVGYESAPHFTRFFKKREGMTPQEYRDRRE